MCFRFCCRLVLLLFAACAAVNCDIPRDQRGTLERVKAERRVRVGLIENKPWTTVGANGEPTGVEVELAKKFAAEFDAAPEWFWGSETGILTALENHELDLAVGGLTEETVWKNKIGLTKPFHTDRIVVGYAASTAPVKEIENQSISVERGDVLTAALIREENAAPAPIENLSPQRHQIAAAHDWQLERLGFILSGIELQKDAHVLAVAPGENGWLALLEEFLKRQRPEVKNLLQQEVVKSQ